MEAVALRRLLARAGPGHRSRHVAGWAAPLRSILVHGGVEDGLTVHPRGDCWVLDADTFVWSALVPDSIRLADALADARLKPPRVLLEAASAATSPAPLDSPEEGKAAEGKDGEAPEDGSGTAQAEAPLKKSWMSLLPWVGTVPVQPRDEAVDEEYLSAKTASVKSRLFKSFR